MSPIDTPSARIQPTACALPSPACDRLAHNRTLLANWLEQDRERRAQSFLACRATRAVLPLLFESLHQHPVASLALGGLAQALVQPLPVGSHQPKPSQALGTLIAVARHHPKTTLAMATLVGAAWWWSRVRPHPSSRL